MHNTKLNQIFFSSGHSSLEDYQFDRVVIDECAQSTEPASLVPLSKGCSNLVLIGDYQQLPATILSREADERGNGRERCLASSSVRVGR